MSDKPKNTKQPKRGPIVTLRVTKVPGGKLMVELPPRKASIIGPIAVHPEILNYLKDFCDYGNEGAPFYPADGVIWDNVKRKYQLSHVKSGYRIFAGMARLDAIALARHLANPANGIDWNAIDPDNPTPEHNSAMAKARTTLVEWLDARGL